MQKPFYITTTLPYVNAKPHIGFALEMVQADTLARYHRLLGENVIFNTGTDEHGLKIYERAQEEGIDTQSYVDGYTAQFDNLKELLDLSYDRFIRTTDAHHIEAAQEFWIRCREAGDIYKKNYQVKYCVGCELEKTDSELEDGKCPLHLSREIELIDEENYFFRFSKFQERLLKLYAERPEFVVPSHRSTEISKFVERGLVDFSISRLKEKMPWGVPVPDDDEHVMYVWFDALVNYVSTLGWPDGDEFGTYWPAIQVAGKDNLRQQSAMWQAMLMSAGLETSKQVFIHGFITSEGKKMSKSAGNVVEPAAVVEAYGVDAVRFFLLGGLSPTEDGDWSKVRFEEFYTAHLANGIGNLTSRILTMIQKYSDSKVPETTDDPLNWSDFWLAYDKAFSRYAFDSLVVLINEKVIALDKMISEQKPWEKVKHGEDIGELLYVLVESLRHIAVSLLPIIPESAQRILTALGEDISDQTLDTVSGWGKLQKDAILDVPEILFPRLS